MTKIKIGLIGLGAMGRVHFDCWRKCPGAELVAISDRDSKKLAGDWGGQSFNLGDQSAEHVDLTGIATHLDAMDLINDPNVQAVDICMPTPQHAPLAMAALRAGKHVFCEKPMALTLDDCTSMLELARDVNRQLMIGHCLRYWPHYVKAKELLDSGAYGRAVYASFVRTSALPTWSAGGWISRASESGGVVLDMHIHDVDVALWWFGEPSSMRTGGWSREGLPLIVDSLWNYEAGPAVHLHADWDPNGGAFRHAFSLVMEKATLVYDITVAEGALRLNQGGKTSVIPVSEKDAYQAELEDFAECIAEGRKIERITPEDSQRAVATALAELRQLSGTSGE